MASDPILEAVRQDPGFRALQLEVHHDIVDALIERAAGVARRLLSEQEARHKEEAAGWKEALGRSMAQCTDLVQKTERGETMHKGRWVQWRWAPFVGVVNEALYRPVPIEETPDAE